MEKVIVQEKQKIIILNTLHYSVWLDHFAEIKRIGNCWKHYFSYFDKRSIHSNRVAWLDHAVSINEPQP
jgi:hypothetical protein